MTDQTIPKTPAEQVAHWLKEIQACREREKDFLKDGQRILELYDGTKAAETPFNILYSNTETLLPALYSAIPRPVVQRRFKDDDPLGKAAADAGQRALEFLLDTNTDGYETYDEGMQQATLTALLPGRAVTAVKFDEEKDYELVCLDSKSWNRVHFGYALQWRNVPWVAYELYIDEEEAVRLVGADMAAKLRYTEQEETTASDETKGQKEEPHQGARKVCRIYQIWDKDGGRKVRTISDQYKDEFLKEQDDPLDLTGFFNCPKPLTFLKKPHSLTPTALYIIYESQAKELNELTRRIKNIAKAIKAKYIYDSELGTDLQKLVNAEENEMVPADKSSSLAAEKGLQNAIWAYPNELQIQVLAQLYATREQCKQVIYEITGISDIIRGASKASETLGAQEIKTQWGTLRLKRGQKEVARYARDLLRMMLEIAATKFSQETWAKMTGLPFLVDAKYNELTKLADLLAQKVQIQMIQAPSAPGEVSQGGPPLVSAQPPPLVSPEVQQLQQVKQALQAPKWADVLAMLQDDFQRAYRIDIETNSTVEPDAAEDQKHIQEVLTTMSQVLQGMGPLVAKGVLPFEAAQVMLLGIIRHYQYGPELEDTIKAMQPPKPEDNGDGAKLAQAQQQMQQLQGQMQQQQAATQLESQRAQAEQMFAQKQAELVQREQALAHQEDLLKVKAQQNLESCTMRDQLHAAKAGHEAKALQQAQWQAERATAMMQEKIRQETELAKAQLAHDTAIEVARIQAASKVQAAESAAEKEPVSA